MDSTANNPSLPASPDRLPDGVQHLPPGVRAAFQRFQTGGESTDLVPVMCAILEDFIPKTPAQPIAGMPGSTRLIEDLGFDSLAITEVVFFTEDLLGINIGNDEIVRLRTLDDLCGFVQGKVADRSER
jgi:acyl carrier protein